MSFAISSLVFLALMRIIPDGTEHVHSHAEQPAAGVWRGNDHRLSGSVTR
jgi:hypothetical protein